MLNHYETVFIKTPILLDLQVKEAVTKFRNIITENGGEIVYEEDWGLKKLAYPIKHKTSGYYYLIEFNAPSGLVKKLEIELKRDERIMRFITIRMDKYAMAFSEKRRALKSGVELPVDYEPTKTGE